MNARHSPRNRTDAKIHKDKNVPKLVAEIVYDGAVRDSIEAEMLGGSTEVERYLALEIQLASVRLQRLLRDYGRVAFIKPEYHNALSDIQTALELLTESRNEKRA